MTIKLKEKAQILKKKSSKAQKKKLKAPTLASFIIIL